MSALSERNELLRQVQTNTKEGAESAGQAEQQFENLASQAQLSIGDTDLGDRVVSVLQQAAGEMNDIMKALTDASEQMDTYLKAFGSTK